MGQGAGCGGKMQGKRLSTPASRNAAPKVGASRRRRNEKQNVFGRKTKKDLFKVFRCVVASLRETRFILVFRGQFT
jgi:hypothetical protein